MISINDLIDIAAAMLTPVIAIVGSLIAFQQWKTNQSREQRESRSLKISIYSVVKRFVNDVIDNQSEVS